MLEFINELPVVDNHGHAFLPDKENPDFRAYWTTSLIPGNQEHAGRLMTYRQAVRALAPLLGLDKNVDEAELRQKRQEVYTSNPAAYTKTLFDDAGIEATYVDIGYPTKSISGYDLHPVDFARIVPCTVKAIVRIEPIIMELIGRQLGFDEFIESFGKT
ncbi:MAG: hypothetical protein HQK55_17405, partial [Deltaproteobacteria bacterium]|nr:hypothetical protein [Deltaproteobacteria bacterium]